MRIRADHGRVPRRDHIAQLRRDGPRQGRRRRRVAGTDEQALVPTTFMINPLGLACTVIFTLPGGIMK